MPCLSAKLLLGEFLDTQLRESGCSFVICCILSQGSLGNNLYEVVKPVYTTSSPNPTCRILLVFLMILTNAGTQSLAECSCPDSKWCTTVKQKVQRTSPTNSC